MTNILKDKILGVMGSLTGSLGFLGGYQVCHSACIGLIALLSLMGIAVVGMPLLFLTKVAVPFWIAAFTLLMISLFLRYKKMMHMPDKLIMLNSGFIIAGVPFRQVEAYNRLFWIAGGILVVFSIGRYIYEKVEKKWR